MATKKTPLYQTDYTFTGGKHTGSILSTSEKGDLTFKKDGAIIRLDPNSSSAKFLLKQQKHNWGFGYLFNPPTPLFFRRPCGSHVRATVT